MAGERDSLVGQVLGGRYRVERLIERGGMGAVYEAVQEPLGRRVALKVLHSHLSDDPVTLERFRREAEASARLRHPNVVQVTDYHAEEGQEAFLVMELVQGRSLAEVMRDDGILPPTRAAHIAVQLLDALAAAHAAGIVHRDLKPTNVLVSSSAALEDVVTVLDFGIAKLAMPPEGGAQRRKLTKQGVLVGTPAYMAPEQARGEDVDERADVYAAGVLLFAMLAGRLPYPQKDRGEVLRAILEQEPPALLDVRPDLAPDLGEIVDRALAKDARERWQTADEMRRALFRWQRRMGHVALTPTLPAPAPSGADADAVGAEEGRQPSVRRWVFFGGMVMAAGLGAVVAWSVLGPTGSPGPTAPPATRPPPEAGPRAARDDGAGQPASGPPASAAPIADPPAPPTAEPPPDPPSAVQPPAPRPRSPAPAGRRLRVMTGAVGRLYAEGALEARLTALSQQLSSCTEGRDVPADAAPPVWYLDVTADGAVRSVRTTMGEWPIAAANCVTRTLRELDLGPTATGDGGQLVLSIALD